MIVATCPFCGQHITLDECLDHIKEQHMGNKQPCGHPVECIVSSDESTHYCGWCAGIVQARKELTDVLERRGFLGIAYEARRERYRDLFRRANAEKRRQRFLANYWRRQAIKETFKRFVARALFKKANASKRKWRDWAWYIEGK